MNFSDFIVYADESGDHNLVSINPQIPVFVLVFCVFNKQTNVSSVVPAIQKLKFDFWGHDGVVFHGHEIRKRTGDFNLLMNGNKREDFIARVSELISNLDMVVIAAAIDKLRHVKQYSDPANP